MNSDDYQLIDQYFSKTLDETELQGFRQKLEEDAEFAAAFETRQEMETFLENRPQREKLKDTLKNIGTDFEAEKLEQSPKIIPLAQKIKRGYWIVGMAAAIALIILLAWPFLFPQSLYDQYNQHRSLALQERGTSTHLDAETAFNQQHYEQAYEALSSYLNEHSDDVRARLALGICALELNRYEEALRIFESIQKGGSALAQSATWYLALTYVKQDQPQKAGPYLEQIQEGSFWYTQAQELLEKI